MPPSRIDQSDALHLQQLQKTSIQQKFNKDEQEQPLRLEGRQLRVLDPNVLRQPERSQQQQVEPQEGVRHHLPFKHQFPLPVFDLSTPTRKLRLVTSSPCYDQPSKLIPTKTELHHDQHLEQKVLNPSSQEHHERLHGQQQQQGQQQHAEEQQQEEELEHFVAQLPPQISPQLDGLVSKLEKKCLVCSKKFPTNRNLKRHVRSVHLSEKNFTCNYCPFQFYDMANLQRHLRLTHKIKDLTFSRTKKGTKRKRSIPEIKRPLATTNEPSQGLPSPSRTFKTLQIFKSPIKLISSPPTRAVLSNPPDVIPKISEGFNYSLESEKFVLDNSEMLTSVMESSNVAGDLEHFLASELGLPPMAVRHDQPPKKPPSSLQGSSTPKRKTLEICHPEKRIKITDGPMATGVQTPALGYDQCGGSGFEPHQEDPVFPRPQTIGSSERKLCEPENPSEIRPKPVSNHSEEPPSKVANEDGNEGGSQPQSEPDDCLPDLGLSPIVPTYDRPRLAPIDHDDVHRLFTPNSAGASTDVPVSTSTSTHDLVGAKPVPQSRDPDTKKKAVVRGKNISKRGLKRAKKGLNKSFKQRITYKEKLELKRFYKIPLPDVEIRKSTVLDNWKKRMLAKRNQRQLVATPGTSETCSGDSPNLKPAQESSSTEELQRPIEAAEIRTSDTEPIVVSDQGRACDMNIELSEPGQGQEIQIPDDSCPTTSECSTTVQPPPEFELVRKRPSDGPDIIAALPQKQEDLTAVNGTPTISSNKEQELSDHEDEKSHLAEIRTQNTQGCEPALPVDLISAERKISFSQNENEASHLDKSQTQNKQECQPSQPGDLKAKELQFSDDENEDKENTSPSKTSQDIKVKDAEVIDPVAELNRVLFESRRNPGKEIPVKLGSSRSFALNGKFFCRSTRPDGTQFLKNAYFAFRRGPIYC